MPCRPGPAQGRYPARQVSLRRADVPYASSKDVGIGYYSARGIVASPLNHPEVAAIPPVGDALRPLAAPVVIADNVACARAPGVRDERSVWPADYRLVARRRSAGRRGR